MPFHQRLFAYIHVVVRLLFCGERLRVTYYSAGEDCARVLEISVRKIFMLCLLILIAPPIAAMISPPAFLRVQESLRVKNLERQNHALVASLAEIKDQINALEGRLAGAKKNEDLLRMYASLPEVDEDVWRVGIGGGAPAPDERNALAGTPTGAALSNLQGALGKFGRQMNLLDVSLAEVERKMSHDQDLRNHTPSINPLPSGVISSTFGKRLDPFIQKVKQHNGIDIVAETGTPVLAPADGVVILARQEYGIGEDFGKFIIIDHGHGIKTRFGHLNRVFIKRGQRVKRYEIIGEVGDTGRSTGPHLHYEVIVQNRYADPDDFILD